ncbi:hypothetical protein [Pseudomonas sp. A4002]
MPGSTGNPGAIPPGSTPLALAITGWPWRRR